MASESELDAVFRAARRGDWVLVLHSHLLALPISVLAFAGSCWAGRHPPFFLIPHYMYWIIAGAAFTMYWSWALVVGMLVFPIGICRGLCYYRHAGTNALLDMGLRGRWAGRPWYRRAWGAFGAACLPTALLVRWGAARRAFEWVEAPARRPSPALMRVVVALAISFHHLPFNYALQASLCVRAPWTLTLPNWLGPCKASLGYAPGVEPFGCSQGRSRE